MRPTISPALALTTWLLLVAFASLLMLLTPVVPATAQAAVPAEPTGLEATEIAYDRVALAWDDPGDSSITGYRVLRRNVDGDEYGDGKGAAEFTAVSEDTGTAETSYTDTTVTPRTRYVYRVKARNAAGLSWHSRYLNVRTPALNAPRAPRGLEAREVSHDRVSLEWEDPENRSITGYQVLRRSVDGEEYGDGEGAGEYVAVVDDTGTSETAYTDRTVGAGTRYGYRVRARNATGLSGRSGNLSVETGALRAPAEPTGLEAGEVSHDRVLLEWDDPDDGSITGYRVLRRPVDGDEYGDGEGTGEYAAVSEDTGTAETGYTDTTVEGRTRYAYRVQAINAAGVSGRSVSRYVSTPSGAPVWTAEMEVGDQGKRVGSEDTYVGYSYFKGTATLVPDRFEHEGRAVAVYALAYSERAGRLAILTSRPLERGLWLQVSGEEYAIAGAAVSRGTDVNYRIYEWEGVELEWEVGEVVSVGLALGEIVLPNVVIILADDLGWGDLGTNNPDSVMTTPNMDGIAAAGVNFTDAHSPSSMCSGTRYGLLTGRYSWRTWMTDGVLGGSSRPLLDRERPTLGTLMQRHGYRTAAIGKWHLGMDLALLRDFNDVNSINRGIDFDAEILDGPLDHGFDEFFGTSANLNWSPNVYIRDRRFLANPSRGHSGNGVYQHEHVLGRLTDEAVGFIQRNGENDAPFFLYLPLHAVHVPLRPSARFEGTTGLGSYADLVAEMDWGVGKVLDAIDQAGIGEDTLVIFTSDNGSSGGIPVPNHEYHRSNGSWRGGKGQIHEGGHRVPFFMRWPAGIEAGSTVDATVSLSDLYATLAEIVGERRGQGGAIDSFSVLPLLNGAETSRPDPVVHHSAIGTFAIRDGNWKLVFGNGDGGMHGERTGVPFGTPWRLFDLEQDPRESTNVAEHHPEVVARLEAELERIRAAGGTKLSSDATLKSLRVAGADIGQFDPHVLTYWASVPPDAETVRVRIMPTATDAEAIIRRGGISNDHGHLGLRLGLEDDASTVSVQVNSPDGTEHTAYNLRVVRSRPPAVVGTARPGETLTADTSRITDPHGMTGAAFTYQWIRNDGTRDQDIAGATQDSYTLVDDDLGRRIKVRVRFIDDEGNVEFRMSGATRAVFVPGPNVAPVGAPIIRGVVEVGEDLTADVTGIADPDGMDNATFGYQWMVGGADIAGATGPSYRPVPDDADGFIQVKVSFTDDRGQLETLTSAAVGPVVQVQPRNAVGSPVIEGIARVGETLTADVSGVSDPDGMSDPQFRYQWIRNDGSSYREISGATAANYRLVSADDGRLIKVEVSFTDDAGNAESVTSGPLVVVASWSPTGLVASVRDDQVVLSWDRAPRSLTIAAYRILRHRPEGGEPEPLIHVEYTDNATTSYTDTTVEPGVLYVYRVQASDYFGEVGPPSDPVAVRMPAAHSPAAGMPTIAGTPRVGETLTADTAAITDPDGLENVSFRHQWLRNDGTTDTEIAGATGSGHTLVKADQGKTIRVRVSFTDDAGNAETRTSEPTATVERRSNRPATGQPTIEGVAQVGRTLTAEVSAIGDGNGMEEAVLSYQWLRDDAEIDGATGAAYAVEAEDAGHSLSVRVSFTDDDGYEEGVSSGAVAVPSPLTGAFDVSTAPESHDGENAFELQMYFSEEPDIGYGSVRSHVLEVENGRVTGARRHDRESSAPNIRWVVIVEPEGDADVTVVLPPTRDCDDEGAVCTGGGKMLSNRSSITVPGPGQESVEPPAKPTGLTGTLNADGSITLSWRAPEGEVTGYQILRRRPEQGETSLAVYVDDTGTEAATYTDTEVTGEGHYVYRVKARNAAGLGPWSNFVKVER